MRLVWHFLFRTGILRAIPPLRSGGQLSFVIRRLGGVMAINLELRTCRLGEGTKKIKNPFDVFGGGEVEVPDDDGLSPHEKSAAKAILDRIAGPEPPSEYIDWSTEFDDGGMVEVWASGLDNDSVVNSRSIVIWRRSPFVSELLLQLSRKGNLAIVTQVEGVGPWLTTAEQLAAVQGRWPAAQVVFTAAELAKKISQSRDVLDMDVD
jgi:hypothetical protein